MIKQVGKQVGFVEIAVDDTLAGERFDRALARLLGSSVRGARRLIEAGEATLDAKSAAPGAALRKGQHLASPPAPTAEDQAPIAEPALPLCVVAETNALLVIDKLAGQPCHPLRPGERGTLANALVARYPELTAVGEFPREAGLVNRIDNDTSGLVLVARTRAAWLSLREDSRGGLMRKRYLALIEGELATGSEWQHIDVPLRHAGQRMRADNAGQVAQSAWRSLVVGTGASLIEVELRVGRHHQIRAHLAHIGHPLIGDLLYGGMLVGARPGHLLHAWRLRLPEADRVNMLDVVAFPPNDFVASAKRFSIDCREPRFED